MQAYLLFLFTYGLGSMIDPSSNKYHNKKWMPVISRAVPGQELFAEVFRLALHAKSGAPRRARPGFAVNGQTFPPSTGDPVYQKSSGLTDSANDMGYVLTTWAAASAVCAILPSPASSTQGLVQPKHMQSLPDRLGHDWTAVCTPLLNHAVDHSNSPTLNVWWPALVSKQHTPFTIRRTTLGNSRTTKGGIALCVRCFVTVLHPYTPITDQLAVEVAQAVACYKFGPGSTDVYAEWSRHKISMLLM